MQAQTQLIDSFRTELYKTTDPLEHIDLQIYLAHYFAPINLDSAKLYAGNVVEESKAINHYENLCHGYLKYSYGYMVNPLHVHVDSIMLYLDSAFNVAKKYNYAHGLSNCYRFRSVVHFQNNDFEKSIEDILIAFERDKAEQDTLSMAYSIINIIDIYRTSRNAEKAYQFIIENKAIINSQKGEEIYYNIMDYEGTVFMLLDKYQESLNIYNLLYKAPSQFSDERKKIGFLEQLAYCHHKLGNADSAAYYFNELVNITDLLNQPIGFAYLSEYLFDIKDYDRAEKYFIKGLQYATVHNLQSDQLNSLSYLAKIQEIKQNYALALDYTQQYAELRDSLQLEELDHLIDKAILNEELDDNIKELLRLKEEQSTMITKHTMLIILSSLSFVLLILLFFHFSKVIYNFQKSNLGSPKNENSNSFLSYRPSGIALKKPIVIAASIYFGFINSLLRIIFIGSQPNYVMLFIWAILSAVLFYAIEYYIPKANKKEQAISIKQQGLNRIIKIIIAWVLSYALYVVINFKSFEVSDFKYIALIIISSIAYATILLLFIHFKHSINALNTELLDSFNAKLQEKQSEPESTVESTEAIHKIMVDNMGKSLAINPKSVLYVVSENVYQEFICFENNEITKTLVRNTMSNIEKLLAEFPEFFRCHRSYIANTNKVISIEGNSKQYYFVMKNTPIKVPVSRTAAKEFATFAS